jgi:hypothetical protein
MRIGARSVAAASLVLVSAGCGSDSSVRVVPDSAVASPDAPVSPEDAAIDAASASVDTAPVDGPLAFSSWPADPIVAAACATDAFGNNLSGLVYEPAASAAAVLWAVQNEPPKLYRLVWNGSGFTPVTTDGFITGKLLRYPGGVGSPDTEGLTRTDWASNELYVVAERDNDDKQVSRQSILRFELGGTKGVLDATHEWVLTADLPPADVNCGLEGIAWIPDSYLVERGFVDESTQAPYVPARYPTHGSGIFLVSYDSNGMIYGYVLDHASGGFTRVATFASGLARAVDLTFDRDTGTLWSLCDSKCNGRMALLDLDGDPGSPTVGRFVLRAALPPPKALADMNNEGIALAPASECSGGKRAFFWADDSATNGIALRRGTITCGRLF